MTASKSPSYYRPSLASRILRTQFQGSELLQATGFLVFYKEQPYLVSNWHVFSGMAPVVNANSVVEKRILDPHGCRLPDAVKIAHVSDGKYVNFVDFVEPLCDELGPLWLEHPEYGSMADVGALALTKTDGITLVSHDPWMSMYIQIGVGDDLSIIGYPFGVQSNGLAI